MSFSVAHSRGPVHPAGLAASVTHELLVVLAHRVPEVCEPLRGHVAHDRGAIWVGVPKICLHLRELELGDTSKHPLHALAVVVVVGSKSQAASLISHLGRMLLKSAR